MKTTNTNASRQLTRGRRNMATLTLLLVACCCSAAIAQSTDRDNPVPLTTNEIRGEGTGKYIEYYYSLRGVPGEIKVTLDATATKETAALGGAEVEVFDEDARKLLGLFVGVGLGSSERRVERLQVRSEQLLVVKLKVERGNDRYMVRFEGSGTQLQKPEPPSGAESSSSADTSPAPTSSKDDASSDSSKKLLVSYIFKNNTAWKIMQLFVVPEDGQDWGANMLAKGGLEPGMTFKISWMLPGSYAIKMIDEHGGTCVRRKVPVEKNLIWTISHSVHVNCVQASQ